MTQYAAFPNDLFFNNFFSIPNYIFQKNSFLVHRQTFTMNPNALSKMPPTITKGGKSATFAWESYNMIFPCLHFIFNPEPPTSTRRDHLISLKFLPPPSTARHTDGYNNQPCPSLCIILMEGPRSRGRAW